jgi:hypothetical protein
MLGDPLEAGTTRRHGLAGQQVGIDHERAEVAQNPRDLALARPDSAG